MNNLKPSATLEMARLATELKSAGQTVFDFSVGEPDFHTPDVVKEFVIEKIRNAPIKYTAVGGIPEVKDAVIKKFKRDNNLDYTNDEVLVANGGKQVIFNAFMATVQRGDEVIVQTPFWSSYFDIIKFFDGTIIPIHTRFEDGFQINPEMLEKIITPNTKWICLNSPSNPCGVMLNEECLKNIAIILKKHPHVKIMSDDIYEHILYRNKKFINILNVAPELKDRTLIINGVSKGHAMTGWRLGFGAGNKALIKAIIDIQSQQTSNASIVSQYACTGALNLVTKEYISAQVKELEGRMEYVCAEINKIPTLKVLEPDGAFYAFINIKEFLEKSNIKDDMEFCFKLLEEKKVALAPGTPFAAPGFLRLSFATDMNTLRDGVAGIKDFIHERLGS